MHEIWFYLNKRTHRFIIMTENSFTKQSYRDNSYISTHPAEEIIESSIKFAKS